MSADSVLVSAIIPVYNGAAFLAEAVMSIQAQGHQHVEIIVVDDGSTDNSREIAESFKGNVRCIPSPHGGAPAARNKGLESAKGSLIAFLDGDDMWSKDKMSLQLALLEQNPPVEIALGHLQRFRQVQAEGGTTRMENWQSPTLAMSMGAAMFRRSVFEKVGPFDESQRYCDDLDWFMRAREMGISILVHPEVALYYRRHENNMTNEVELGNQHMLRMLKKSIGRRKKHEGGSTDSLPSLSTFTSKQS